MVKDRLGRFNLATLEPMLEDLHSRLSGVVIEYLDRSAFIPRYDALKPCSMWTRPIGAARIDVAPCC